MRLDARMSSRSLLVLLLALAACGLGRAGPGARSNDPRTPYVFHGTGEDTAVDVATGAAAAALVAAGQGEPAAPLCAPENESGNPPHTCPEKAGEQPATK